MSFFFCCPSWFILSALFSFASRGIAFILIFLLGDLPLQLGHFRNQLADVALCGDDILLQGRHDSVGDDALVQALFGAGEFVFREGKVLALGVQCGFLAGGLLLDLHGLLVQERDLGGKRFVMRIQLALLTLQQGLELGIAVGSHAQDPVG